MAENAIPVDSIDNRYYRRAGVTAAVYAVVDLLILIFGGLFIPFRLIGVIAAYFVVRDMIVLRDAGVEWGWTRYLVLVLVAVGGFLGFIVYAWRRYSHLQEHTWPETDSEESNEASDGDAAEVQADDPAEEAGADQVDEAAGDTAPDSDREEPG